MLTRKQIDERLARWALDNSQREALETAQKLYAMRAEKCDDCETILERKCTETCPLWLRGEGE